MSVEYRSRDGKVYKIPTTPDDERMLQAGEITIADLLITKGITPMTVNPSEPTPTNGAPARAGGGAPDAVRKWLKYYPGLAGANGEPNQWAYLLQNTVAQGLKSGKLNLDTYRNLESGKVAQAQLQQVLDRAQGGAADPWETPSQQIGSEDVLTALGQTNPLSLALYGGNKMFGTSIGEGVLTPPQGMNPFGPLTPGQEQRVAPLRPMAGLAQSFPMGMLGRLTGGAMGGTVDAGVEAARQDATAGRITSPTAVVAQGALGAAANIVPGLGVLGTGGRVARSLKAAAPMAAYGAGSQAISNAADASAGLEPAADPMEAAKFTGLLGLGLGAIGGGKVAKGGTLQDKGMIGQIMDARAAARAPGAPTPGTRPPTSVPNQAPPGAPSTDLQAVNTELRDLARAAQYDSPRYQQLLGEQRRLQAALDVSPKPPPRDTAQQLQQAQDELAALQAAGVTSERIAQLKRRIARLGKGAAPATAATTAPVQPTGVVPPPEAAAPPAGEIVAGVPKFDEAVWKSTVEPKLRELHAAGRLTKPEGGMTPEADALMVQAFGNVTGEGGAPPAIPPKQPAAAKVPPAPGVARQRFAAPFTSAEEMRTKAPKVYRAQAVYLDKLVKQLGYPAAKQWVEATASGRQPQLKVGADPAGRALLATTQTLSKTPNHLRLIWGQLGPHYEKRAAQAGVQDPTKAIKTLSKKVAGTKGAISPELVQSIKAKAEELGAADVASDAPFIANAEQAAAQVGKLKAQSKLGQQLAGYVPPSHKASPLSVWPLAELENAARAMFSSRKKTIGEPSKAQILAAGSRLMERYEKQVALGTDPVEAARTQLELGKSGRLREHRFHAQGMAKAKLQDWMGAGGGSATSLGPRLDAPEKTVQGMESSTPATASTETAFTMAEQALVDAKISRKQNVKGVKKGATAADPAGLVPKEGAVTPQAGPKLGDKLLASAPLAFYPQDDEDDDTSTYARRLASLGLGVVAGASLWNRSRKAWRLGGKPVPKLSTPVRPGQAAALVHDDVPRVIEIAKGIKSQFPSFADKVEVHAIDDAGSKGAALYLPKELENDAAFTRRFSRTLAAMDVADVKDAATKQGKQVPPAPKAVSTEDAFSLAGEQTATEGPPPADTEFGSPAMGDEDAFSSAAYQTAEEGAGSGIPGAPQGRKLQAPIFSDEADVEVLDSQTPSAVHRTDKGTFAYDPRQDRRMLLRDPRALTDYEKQLAREGAQRGEVPLPNPGGVKWYSSYDPTNADDPLAVKLAQVRKDKPFAQATVIQNDKTGRYAISVNEHGFLGPVVRMRRKDDSKIVTGYKPDVWAGYSSDYVKAFKAGQVKPPRQVTRVKGHDVLPYEVWSPTEARTIEIPVEGAKGQGYKRVAAGDEGKGTTGLQPVLSGKGVQTQKIEVSNRPVAVFQGKNPGQVDKVATALKRQFGDDFPVLRQQLPNGDTVLAVDRRRFDQLNRMEREVVSELPRSPNPDAYTYIPTEFSGKPTGVSGERVERIEKAPSTKAELSGVSLSQDRIKAYEQASKQKVALQLQRAKEPDLNKRAALDTQIRQLTSQQFGLMRDRKDPAKTGNLTWKEATNKGFKVIEVSANENRVAEIRKALRDEFGDKYTDHFVARGQKTPGGFKWHIAISPEFMEGAARLSYERGAVGRERVRLKTGALPPAPKPQAIIKNDRVNVALAPKQMVEFSSRSGVERGIIEKVSEDGQRAWVRQPNAKSLIPVSKDFLRVVEAGGRTVNPKLPQLGALADNELVRPLVAKLTAKPADQLTDQDFDQTLKLLLGEADKQKRGALETIAQAYKDNGVTPPAALAEAMRRLQPRGLTGASREVQDMAANVAVDPYDVVTDVLWNINAKKPTVGQVLKFTRELDVKIEDLVKQGLVDRADTPKARLVLLQRLASQAGASENTDRAEQLASTVQALEEAVRGLPRDPFGGSALPRGGAGASTLSGSQGPPNSVDDITAGLLGGFDLSPSGRLTQIVSEIAAGKAARGAQGTYGMSPAQLKAYEEKLARIGGGGGTPVTAKDRAFRAAEVDPHQPLPPKPDVEVVRGTPDAPVTTEQMRSADAIIFYDTPIVGRPTRGTKPVLYALPGSSDIPFKLRKEGGRSTMGYDVVPGRVPTIEPGKRKPSTLGDAWQQAGKLSARKLTKRVLNPTVSQLQKLLTTFSPVTGPGTRRQPRIVVIGDDGGQVDFALASQKAGGTALFEQAIADAKVSVGVKPGDKMNVVEWQKALADPKNWRLLSILPAMAAGAAEAEAADGSQSENGFRKYLPALVTLGLVAGGVAGLRAYRNRPVVPRMATGPTAIEALAARQKTQLAKQLAPTPLEVTGTAIRKALQNKFVRLEQEQGKHAAGDLLPHERAMDVWAQRLGGGGGVVDASVIRINKTLTDARKEGLADALVDELNIRGAERVRDTLTRRVIDTENRVTSLKTKVKDLNQQIGKATSKTDKMTLGKERSLALRALSRSRRRLGQVGKAMTELHAGNRLPGGLTPGGLSNEKALLAARPGRNQGRVSQLAERIYQEARQVMDQSLQAGVIPKVLYDEVVSKDKGYVNLRRYFEHVQTTRVGKLKQAFGPNASIDVTTDRILKHLEGSDVDPLHPIQSLTLFLRSAHQELAQQDATRSMVDLLRKDSQNLVKRVKVDQQGVPVGKDLAYVRDNEMGVLTHLHEGLPVHYAVPKWASQLAEVAGSAPIDQDAFMRMLGKARGWSQASMTSLQAPFQVVNMIRDVSTAGKLVPEAYERLNPIDVGKRYKEWATSLFEIMKGSADYQQMLEEGASYSTFTKGLDPNLYKDLLDAKLLGNDRRVLRTIQQTTSAIEEATKLMTWKRLRDRQVGSLDRVTKTRQFGGSPDFWFSGDWSRGLGTALLFFNPAIQGITQSVRGVQKHGKFLLAGALGGAALNHAWNSQFSNDDGELDLYDVDKNVRSNNFVFLKPWLETDENGRTKRGYWAIPKPHISQLLYQPIEAALEARERGTVDLEAMMNTMLAKLMPVTSESFEMERPTSIVEGAAASLQPALRVGWEAWADRRLFGDRPIEGKAFEHTRKSERFRPSTGMLFRDFGKAVGKVQSLGGTPGEGLSPLKSEYVARSLFPGPVDALSDTYDTIGGLFGREVPKKPGGRIPVVSSVMRRFSGPQYEGARINQQRNEFYALLERARKDQRVGPREGIAPYARFLEKNASTLAVWRKQREHFAQKAKTGDKAAQQQLDRLLKAEHDVLTRSASVVQGRPK